MDKEVLIVRLPSLSGNKPALPALPVERRVTHGELGRVPTAGRCASHANHRKTVRVLCAIYDPYPNMIAWAPCWGWHAGKCWALECACLRAGTDPADCTANINGSPQGTKLVLRIVAAAVTLGSRLFMSNE